MAARASLMCLIFFMGEGACLLEVSGPEAAGTNVHAFRHAPDGDLLAPYVGVYLTFNVVVGVAYMVAAHPGFSADFTVGQFRRPPFKLIKNRFL
jgi:hypothetical protein